jgi:hypothetical protein
MNPYQNLSPQHFWRTQVSTPILSQIDYDAGRKFVFDVSSDRFATAGSCFAQHFGRELARRGGHFVIAETRHPLVSPAPYDGYDLFSARFGNIYTTRQLCELIEQAFGIREPIFEFAQRDDGRWTDLLRPRAVDEGFTSFEEARADRIYHLHRVRAIFDEATVFVFTLGLTECWEDSARAFVYPMCPGTVAGTFDGSVHRYRNLGYEECRDDLRRFCRTVQGVNPQLRVLLTVSPVMLVASYENRGALQSSIASKSILRTTADACCREMESVDYFPSFEIISGPQSRGTFYEANHRDVSSEGVSLVMDVFFRSRLGLASSGPAAPAAGTQPARLQAEEAANIAAAVQAECDEIFLDPGLKTP